MSQAFAGPFLELWSKSDADKQGKVPVQKKSKNMKF